ETLHWTTYHAYPHLCPHDAMTARVTPTRAPVTTVMLKLLVEPGRFQEQIGLPIERKPLYLTDMGSEEGIPRNIYPIHLLSQQALDIRTNGQTPVGFQAAPPLAHQLLEFRIVHA